MLEGIELQRFPLVDPETGEPIEPVEPTRPEPPAREEGRGRTIVWSLALHVVSVTAAALVGTLVVVTLEREWVERFSEADAQSIIEEQWAFVQRPDFREMSPEHRAAEIARITRAGDPQILVRAQLILHGALAFGFFLGGLAGGRLRRPRRLMDVGLGALLASAVVSLCCGNPAVALLGFFLSLAGTWLGRRWALGPTGD